MPGKPGAPPQVPLGAYGTVTAKLPFFDYRMNPNESKIAKLPTNVHPKQNQNAIHFGALIFSY